MRPSGRKLANGKVRESVCSCLARCAWNNGPALEDRIDGVKPIRDQAKADVERAQAMLGNSGQKTVTPQMLCTFAGTARQSIRLEGGGYRHDHLRALAQRVEVGIMGSKSRRLQTLVAGGGVNSAPTQSLGGGEGGIRTLDTA